MIRCTVIAAPVAALAIVACGLDAGGLAASGVDASAPDGATGGPDVFVADGATGADVADAPAILDTGPEDTSSADAYPCFDTFVDPHNCGTCGHDCRGETCTGGFCQPETLANNQGSVDFVRLNATDIYFTTGSGGQVNTCPLSDCSNHVTNLLSVFAHGFVGLAIDGQNFYTADTLNGNMVSCAFTGCGTIPNVGVATAGGQGNGVFVSGGTVYWVDQSNNVNSGGSGSIWSSNLDGSNPTNLAPNLADPIDVLVVGANAYWTVSQAGHVDTCPLSNCAGGVSQIAAGQKNPQYLATDGLFLYWTNDGSGNGTPDGSLVQSTFDGKTQTTIAQNLPSPRGLVIDSGDVYWANFVNHNSGSGTVMTCPVGAPCSTPTVLAQNLAAPFGVATDALYVYWGDDGDGTIKRVAK